MQTLTVLFDPTCRFCWQCTWWLGRQPQYVELEFLRYGGDEAKERFPTLNADPAVGELTVVSDAGGVYTGTDAFLICLWALKAHRELSLRLARPGWHPWVRRAFDHLSRKRHVLSRFVFGDDFPPELGGSPKC
jgi:predicted DCC family thiol-disulfide oxidoreductase YuxK